MSFFSSNACVVLSDTPSLAVFTVLWFYVLCIFAAKLLLRLWCYKNLWIISIRDYLGKLLANISTFWGDTIMYLTNYLSIMVVKVRKKTHLQLDSSTFVNDKNTRNSWIFFLRLAAKLDKMFREICLVEVFGSTCIICLIGYYLITVSEPCNFI